MTVNADKPDRWKADIVRSVDFYNDWFLRFAPRAYRETRERTTKQVEAALASTSDLRDISPAVLRQNPRVLQMLRMATAPPIARDRLIGLAGVSPNLVKSMEDKGRLPPRLARTQSDTELVAMAEMIRRLADVDILTWLESDRAPEEQERYRAATVIADRLCGAVANPIIRNAQEYRQLACIRQWLEGRGYLFLEPGQGVDVVAIEPGHFCFHLPVPALLKDGKKVIVSVDAVILPRTARKGDLPVLVEAKSAGDFTNVNKRRKEEATKVNQLREAYGDGVRYILFLCGYFDSGYLGYEAAEGIDWVWEHRIDDLAEFGL